MVCHPGEGAGGVPVLEERRVSTTSDAAVTLVERSTRYALILGLPDGKEAAGVADALIDRLHGLPGFMRQGLTWDQGTEMAEHASVTVAADLPIYFARPHSPWGLFQNVRQLAF